MLLACSMAAAGTAAPPFVGFTADYPTGNINTPAGAVLATYQLVGAGASGLGDGTLDNGGYGGRGGDAVKGSFAVSPAGETLTCQKGVGGVRTSAAQVAGTPSFIKRGATVLANAAAGTSQTASSGGNVGDAIYLGGNGGNGTGSSLSLARYGGGGGGAAGATGAGGVGGNGVNGTGGAPGAAGVGNAPGGNGDQLYGGGGTGADNISGTGRPGNNGRDGLVRITWS